MDDPDYDDTNIVATDIVMLQIVDKETGEKVLDVVNANSNLNVRPLEFEFTKETEGKIQTNYKKSRAVLVVPCFSVTSYFPGVI